MSGRTYATSEVKDKDLAMGKSKKRRNYKLPKYKQYKYLYSKILDKSLIRKAFMKMRKGKRKKTEVQRIEQNFDYYVDFVYDMLLNTRPNAEHPERAFSPKQHDPITIVEHGKERKIYIPSILEQWIHHIIMQVLSPILIKMFHPDSYGSIPNKGLHKAKKHVVKYRKNYKYGFKMDIRHFFANIRLNKLEEILKKFITDDWFVNLIMICFKWHKKGLPLGFYLSQWMSNVYLNEVDYLIVKHKDVKFIRYVDDIVIFGNNKKKIRQIFDKIKQHIGKLRLTVKGNYHLSVLSKEPINFLGFVFKCATIRLRKSIISKIKKVVSSILKALKNGRTIWKKLIRSFMSYNGWLKCSNSRKWSELYIDRKIIIKNCKTILLAEQVV